AELLQLLERGADERARHREADAFVAARLAQDERVDADQLPGSIHQRAAAVAGINRRVGLNVANRSIRIELSRDGADDAHAHRIVQADGTAKGEDNLALPELRVVGEG